MFVYTQLLSLLELALLKNFSRLVALRVNFTLLKCFPTLESYYFLRFQGNFFIHIVR